ncbi:MAG: phosphohydrolase [Bacteroidetes bacterium HGW-Bacteroidetes-17]|nr:MAG: phosphohydrolase [Bacteroidetes bacterium HGW-Bacteroidetes-17]
MNLRSPNKRKIFNDPVYGFISIPHDLIFDLIEHPYFQRLRRIRQLGLTHLIYPGALHTRFHHSIGAMHLTCQAIAVLKEKGHQISAEEELGVEIAILLHDVGHGPYSHTLEHSLVEKLHHEEISGIYMNLLNEEFKGQLRIGIQIFKNTYPKKYLHQLVSSQLDMDRLDYLKRDSFFTGVAEGNINADRIIKMLQLVDDELVIEAKGIYSVEKFIIARRLMYWQVYLHKTVLAAEHILMRILKRAKLLTEEGEVLFATSALSTFLKNNFDKTRFSEDSTAISAYSQLDDFDIMASIKEWTKHKDPILSYLSHCIVNRNLFRIEIQDKAFKHEKIQKIKELVKHQFQLNDKECEYFVISDSTSNSAYNLKGGQINILFKNGDIKDIVTASDLLNNSMLSQPVTKHFLCYPKNLMPNKD